MGFQDWQETNTLANLITDALQSAGIPLLADPIQLYNTGPATTTGTPGIFGAYVEPSNSETWAGALDTWEGNTGITAQGQKIYFPNNTAPNHMIDPVQNCITDGLKAYLCYTPTETPPYSTSDANRIIASVNAFLAGGLPLANTVVVLWQELGNGHFRASDVIGGYQFYVPKIRAGVPGVKIGWNAPGEGLPGGVNAFDPGPGFYDLVAIDIYGNHWVQNQGSAFAKALAVAQAGNKPFGVWEIGSSVGAAITNANVIAFLQYLTGQALSILQNNGVLDAWMWWQNDGNPTGPNVIANSGDFRIPYLQALAAAVTAPAGGSGGVTIPGGGNVTLSPLKPTPGGGLADADGMSYDIALQVQAGAGSTSPFITVQIFFYDDDTATARAVDRVYWHIPLGSSGSGVTRIYGNGPQSGRFMSITLHNGDTVTCSAAVQVNSTARQRDIHDWNWSVADSNSVPTYNLASGAGYSANLGEQSGANVNAGVTKGWLMSLGAGRVWFWVSSTTGNVDVQLLAQPSGAFGTAPIWETTLAANAPQGQMLLFPRAPVLVNFTNNGAGAASISFQCIKER